MLPRPLPLRLPCQLPGSEEEAGAQRLECFAQAVVPRIRQRNLRFLQARKMRVVLPEIMATLQDASTDIKMKALFVLQNIMGCVKRKEASSIALQHAEELLPLFVDVSEAAVGGRALAGAPCSATASGPAVWAALALGPLPSSLLPGSFRAGDSCGPSESPVPSICSPPLASGPPCLLRCLCKARPGPVPTHGAGGLAGAACHGGGVKAARPPRAKVLFLPPRSPVLCGCPPSVSTETWCRPWSGVTGAE